jgi:hypothetical protein
VALSRGFPRVGFPTTLLCDVRTFLEGLEALRDCLACPLTVPRRGAERTRGTRHATLRRVSRVHSAFASYVRRSSDRRIELTVGSSPALRLLFGRAAHAYRPSVLRGIEGGLAFDLRDTKGRDRPWTLELRPEGARARPGHPSDQPLLVVRLTVADLVRIGAGELSPGKALLTGRLDVRGDFAIASKLGAMFGRSGPF